MSRGRRVERSHRCGEKLSVCAIVRRWTRRDRVAEMTRKFDPISIDELKQRRREFSEPQHSARAPAKRLASGSKDGRQLRSREPKEQLNLRVPASFKQELFKEAQETGLTMAELVEEAWKLYVASKS